mgnify:CR=1 FL=1
MKRHRITLMLAVKLVQRGWSFAEDFHGRVRLVSPRGRRWWFTRHPAGFFEAAPLTKGFMV